MAANILMIRHMTDETDDSAAEILAEEGFALEHWRSDVDGVPADPAPYAAVVVYGGPHAVEDADYVARELEWIKGWARSGKPYVGFCLGGQLLASAAGAHVGPRPDGLHEVGFREIVPTESGRDILPRPLHLSEFHYHGISDLPAAAEILAGSRDYPVQAFRLNAAQYGFQFHPEVNERVLRRWLTIQDERESKPGVDSAEKQLADARKHLGPQRDWLRMFLRRWSASFARPARRGTLTAAAH